MIRAGLIVPPAIGRVPPDMALMYPRTEVLVEGIGVASLTGEGYDEAKGRVADAARRLAERGATGILLFGTSMSFHGGKAGNAELEATMRDVSGVPSMTLTSAMEMALRLAKIRRMAVATAYSREVNDSFRRYFESAGFQISAINGMDLTRLDAVEETGRDAILGISRSVWTEDADGLVISCAGLTTAEAAVLLEAETGRPVLSSAMVGAWAAQGLAGGNTSVSGFGDLYQREGTTWPSG